MKKLPTIKEIDINGSTFTGIEISTVISRDIPTVLYKNKYYISVETWVYLEFGIRSDHSYFLVDNNNQEILQIILNYPHKLNLSNIEGLKLYKNVTIESNLSMEDENPYLIIEVS